MYEITSDLLGECENATLDQIQELLPKIEGWRFKIEDRADALRLYCYREGSEDRSPDQFTNWIMVTDDYGYTKIGHAL